MSYLHTFSIADPDYIWVMVCNKLQSDRNKITLIRKTSCSGIENIKRCTYLTCGYILNNFCTIYYYSLLRFVSGQLARFIFLRVFFCILTEIRVYFKYFYHMYVHVVNQKEVHVTLKSRFY